MRSTKKNNFISASIMLAGILFFLSGCKNDLKQINNLNVTKNTPTETDTDVNLYYSTNANVNVKLTAPLLERYDGDKPYIVFRKGVAVYFYDSLKKVSSQLHANYAINRIYKNEMEAKGNVVIQNNKGEKLNSEDLIWNQKKDLIYSNDFVKITKKDEILMGTGFKSNSDFSNYKIENIQGDIHLNENDSLNTNKQDSVDNN